MDFTVHDFDRLASVRVLVVDDYPDSAASLACLLRQRFGCRVKMCVNGRDCEAMALAFKPHVMFLDLGMPGKDGFEVAKALRQHHVLDGLVLVALTGFGTPDVREHTREVGFDYCLLKPAELKDIFPILCQCVPSPDAAEHREPQQSSAATDPWTEFG